MSQRSKTITWGLPIIGLAAIAAGVQLVSGEALPTGKEQPIRMPTSAPVEQTDGTTGFIGAIGVSEPAGEAILIAPQVSEVVRKIMVKTGQSIGANDPLFQQDSRIQDAAVGQVEAAVRVASARLDELRIEIPVLQAAVATAQARISGAAASLEAARTELADRQSQLSIAESITDKRAISQEEMRRRSYAVATAQARVEVAIADLEAARAVGAEAEARLARLRDPASGENGATLIAAVAQVDQAKADLQLAQQQRDILTVRSPVEGRVLQVNIRVGEFARAGGAAEAAVVVGRSGPLHLRVEIDEVDMPQFRRGARAWASPRGAADLRLELELVLVEPLMGPKTNLSGRTSELVDTRVLQVVYRLPHDFKPAGTGQQFDVYIERGDEE